MDLDDDKKFAIIGRVYTSSMGELNQFRTTAGQILFWSSGASMATVGWVVSNSENFDSQERIVIGSAIITFLIVASVITRRIETYLLEVAKVINKIDKLHKAFDKHAYIENNTLLPKEWDEFGADNWREPIFRKAQLMYLQMGVICVIGITIA